MVKCFPILQRWGWFCLGGVCEASGVERSLLHHRPVNFLCFILTAHIFRGNGMLTFTVANWVLVCLFACFNHFVSI